MVLAPSTPMRPVSRLRHFWVRKARILHSWGTRPCQDRTWNAFKWLEIIHQSLAIHPGNNNLLCGTWLECQEACPPLFGTRFTNVACCVSRRDWMGTADTGMGSSPALDQGSHQAIILVGGCRLSKLWSKVLQLSDLSVRWKVKRWISCPSWCSKIH